MSTSYDKLKALVDNGDAEIITVISPPRNMSTRGTKAIAETGQVDLWFNEPFAKMSDGENRLDSTYEDLYTKISAIDKPEGRPLRVVVCEIAQDIAPGQEFDDLSRLS